MLPWLTIISGLNKALGRALLVVGLAPALALILTLRYYTGGLDSIVRFILPFAQGPDAGTATTRAAGGEVSAQLLGSAAMLLLVAGLFFTLRGLVLRLAESFPVPLLSRRLWSQRFVEWQETTVRNQRATGARQVLAWAGSGLKGNVDGHMATGGPWKEILVGRLEDGTPEFAEAVHLFKQGQAVAPELLRSALLGLTRVAAAVGANTSCCQEQNQEAVGRWQWQLSFMPDDRATSWAFAQLRAIAEGDLAEAALSMREWPGVANLRPTRFGNTLSRLEAYCDNRFGIATSVLWLRLGPLLDEPNRKEVADAQCDIQAWLNLSVAFGVVGVGVAFHGLQHLVGGNATARLPPASLSVPVLAGSFLLSYASYLMATFAVGGYAERIIRLVDLHRDRLYSALRLPQPPTTAEERKLLGELGLHFVQGAPLNRDFELGKGATPAPIAPASPAATS